MSALSNTELRNSFNIAPFSEFPLMSFFIAN
jgi:hypothetical protein